MSTCRSCTEDNSINPAVMTEDPYYLRKEYFASTLPNYSNEKKGCLNLNWIIAIVAVMIIVFALKRKKRRR